MSKNSVANFALEKKIVPIHSIWEAEASFPFASSTREISKEFISLAFDSNTGNTILDEFGVPVSKSAMTVLTRMETKSVDSNTAVMVPSTTFGTRSWNYLSTVGTPTATLAYWEKSTRNTAATLRELGGVLGRHAFIPWLSNVYAGRAYGNGTIYMVAQLCMNDKEIQSLVTPSIIPSTVLTSDTDAISFMTQLVFGLFAAWNKGFVFDLLYFTVYEHRDVVSFKPNADMMAWIDKLMSKGKHVVDGYDFSIYKNTKIQARWSPIILPMTIMRKRKAGEKFADHVSRTAAMIGITSTYDASSFASSFVTSTTGVDASIGNRLRANESDPRYSHIDLYSSYLANPTQIKTSLSNVTLTEGTYSVVNYLVKKWLAQFVGHDVMFEYPTLEAIYDLLISVRYVIDTIKVALIDTKRGEWASDILTKSILSIVSRIDGDDKEKAMLSLRVFQRYIESRKMFKR